MSVDFFTTGPEPSDTLSIEDSIRLEQLCAKAIPIDDIVSQYIPISPTTFSV